MKSQENVNIRMLVLEMLLTVSGKSQQDASQPMYSHIVVREVLNKYNYLSQKEKAFIKRLFEGTLERMIELDYVINIFSKVKVNKQKPVIRTILRMGAYQILYMDAVPDSAACNEAVKLAQKKGFATLKGFVNGILRNISRNKDSIEYPDPKSDFEYYLSVKYSMPDWIVSMWIEQLGSEKTENVLEGLLKEHPVTVRFRQEGTFIEKFKNVLTNLGGSMEQHSYLQYAYKITKTDDITQLPGYENGNFLVQDVSSMLAVEALVKSFVDLNGLEKEGKIQVLDICAAPGGKSMLIADLLKKAGIDCYVEARDISENKTCIMNENFERCGFDNVRANCFDATIIDEEWIGKADIVIADVPCSGLGVIGKKRDIKYKMSKQSIDAITELQENILDVAYKYLKKDGLLLFSTCTVNKAENNKHFEWLKNEKNMTAVSLKKCFPQLIYADTANEGYIQLLPGIHDADGFFFSVLKK